MKTYSIGFKVELNTSSLTNPNDAFAYMLEKFTEKAKKNLKKSILTDLYTQNSEVIYETKRFRVELWPTSKINIYDKKTGEFKSIKDVKENPKEFTKDLVKKVPFFELYEKTQ